MPDTNFSYFKNRPSARHLPPVNRHFLAPMEVTSPHFQLEHTKAYTGIYSMTCLIVSKDTYIHARPLARERTAPSQVLHTLARLPALAPLRVSPHPYARFLSASPLPRSRVYFRTLNIHRSIPISHFYVL